MEAPESEEAGLMVKPKKDEDVVKGEVDEIGLPEVQEGMLEGTITLEQWEGMSRKQREALGLPTSKVGIQQITRNGIIELPKPEVAVPPVESVREKTEKKFGLSKERQEELIDSGDATEMDFQLLSDSGDDILDFIKDGGYSLSSMGVTEGLSDWAEQNKKQLPFNMNFLIRFVVGTLRASQE
jgi:hypothetical protein